MIKSFKEIKERLNDEKAEIMLESVIVVIIVLFMLIAFISMGFMFYQQSLVNSVAMELAEDVGANFKFLEEDDNDGSPKINLYRTSINLKKSSEKHQADTIEKCKERLRISSFGIADNEPNVDMKLVVDNVGRLHSEVTVTLECSILFDGALKYFGIIDSTPEFSATARGECLDITAYAGQANFMKYILIKPKDTLPNITTIIEQTVGIVNDGVSIWKIFTGE